MAFNLSKIIFTGRALWQCIHFYCLWYSLNQLCIIWEKNCRKIFNWSFKIGAEMHEWQAKTKTKPLGWAIKMMKILNIKFSIKISEWLCRYALKLTQSINQSLSLSLSLSLVKWGITCEALGYWGSLICLKSLKPMGWQPITISSVTGSMVGLSGKVSSSIVWNQNCELKFLSPFTKKNPLFFTFESLSYAWFVHDKHFYWNFLKSLSKMPLLCILTALHVIHLHWLL